MHSLAGGEVVEFSIDVPAQTATRIRVRQNGIDVGLAPIAVNAARPSRAVDLAGGIHGEEQLVLPIGDSPATWTIAVQPVLTNAARGEFEISVDRAPADDRARAVATAWDVFLENYYTPGGAAKLYEKTAKGYADAAEAALSAGDRVLGAEATFLAARIRDLLGDTPAAIEWQHRALALFREIGRRDREGRVLNRLGDLSRKVGEIADAQKYFEEALPIARAANDAVTVVDILNNSGILLLWLGRWEEAIAQMEGAIPLAQQAGTADVESALTHNIGECWSRLGVYDKAIAAYERSIELKRPQDSPRRVSRTLRSLAVTQFESGDRAASDESIRGAIELAEKSGDRTAIAETLGVYGLMLHAAGQRERALESFTRALPILREVQSRSGQVDVLTAWAQADIDANDADAALAKLDEALPISRAILYRRGEAEGQYFRALALRKKGDRDAAIAAIEKAIEIVSSRRGSIVRSELRTSYMAKVRRYFDLYIELLQERGLTARAFEANESSRARTLLEGLADSAAKIAKGIDPALLRRQRALQAELNAKENYRAQLLLKGDRSAAVAATTTRIDRLSHELSELETAMGSANPGWSDLEMPAAVTVDRVRKSLIDSNTALVEFHLGANRSFAWVIDRKSVTVHELPPAARIETLARRYHELLSAPVSVNTIERQKRNEEIAIAGRRLAAAVWKPLASRAAAKRLLIVADGALQYVPFAALPSPNEPLVTQHEIVYLPSASVLETIRRRSRGLPANATAAVFADPVFSADDERLTGAAPAFLPANASRGANSFARLRFSRDEAAAIAASARGSKSFQALDFVAAKKTLVSRDLRGYAIVHFATHGVLNTQRPELSGLVLSLVDASGKPVDGYLRLHEIYNLDLDADLVVLSACRTALGKDVHGEGLIGLTRGFMYAGASRVVSSVWNVDDRASAQLMSRFYSAMLANGTAPAAALREAQLALLKNPRWSSPHYWAAFGIQGDWR